MGKIISMKDIRLTLAAIAKRAEAGESFTVVRDSKPVFRIEPLGKGVPAGNYETSSGGAAQKPGRVRDPGEVEWTPQSVEADMPLKIRKKLNFPNAKLVFHEDKKGHIIVSVAEPSEFTREEWARFLKKTQEEPVTRFRNKKEFFDHLDALADPK